MEEHKNIDVKAYYLDNIHILGLKIFYTAKKVKTMTQIKLISLQRFQSDLERISNNTFHHSFISLSFQNSIILSIFLLLSFSYSLSLTLFLLLSFSYSLSLTLFLLLSLSLTLFLSLSQYLSITIYPSISFFKRT